MLAICCVLQQLQLYTLACVNIHPHKQRKFPWTIWLRAVGTLAQAFGTVEWMSIINDKNVDVESKN